MAKEQHRHGISNKAWEKIRPQEKRECEEEIRQWAVQKGAQHQDTSGLRFFITSDTTADCRLAAQLIEGFQAEYLLADRGYDTDAILLKVADQGMIPVIPPKKNRNHPRKYDKYIYKLRHLAPCLLTTLSNEAVRSRNSKRTQIYAFSLNRYSVACVLLIVRCCLNA